MKLSLQHYLQKLPRQCLMNWLQCSFSDFWRFLEEDQGTILILITVGLVMASWCCNMPKFTDQLPAQFLVLSVTVWQCFPEVPLSHSAPRGSAQATWREALGHLSIWGHEQWLQFSFSLLLSGRISILDFQARHHFQLRGAPVLLLCQDS